MVCLVEGVHDDVDGLDVQVGFVDLQLFQLAVGHLEEACQHHRLLLGDLHALEEDVAHTQVNV